MKPTLKKISTGPAPEAARAIALPASCLLLFGAALWPSPWAFAVLVVAGYLAETWVARREGGFAGELSRVGLGVTLRFTLREIALLVLLARLGHASSGWFALFACGLLGLHALRAVHSGLVLFVRRRRLLPVVTRRIDLSALKLPDAPPRLLDGGHVRGFLHLDVPPVAGAVIGALAGGALWPGLAGLAVSVAAGAAAIAVMLPHALRSRSIPGAARVLKVVSAEVARLAPEVVLYFSGSPVSAYQANMWLETIDRLDRRALIILRERHMVELLGRTSTPILCVPSGPDLMNFPLPSVRVALFPANIGNNIHMLRLPEVRQVFIGHGDSDKAASFNPFSKVYDEVWVAGPAGRERYLRSGVGVRDEDIVEVGRPQLAPIVPGPDTPDPILTVLYAPTWEGWAGDPFHTSLLLMGPALVRGLLDRLPHVRLLYKPHPLTGKDNPRVGAAHRQIVAMIERANAERESSGVRPGGADVAEARRELERLGARLAELGAATAGRGSGDETQLSRDGARFDAAAEDAWRRTTEEWNRAYWASQEVWKHRVVTGPNPHLYECFNRSDLLITDISSVLADYAATGRPYVVTNPAGGSAERFREVNPSAAAAYLLGPDCAELQDILDEVVKSEADAMAERRAALKNSLLGEDHPDAMTRFNDAVNALADKAVSVPRAW